MCHSIKHSVWMTSFYPSAVLQVHSGIPIWWVRKHRHRLDTLPRVYEASKWRGCGFNSESMASEPQFITSKPDGSLLYNGRRKLFTKNYKKVTWGKNNRHHVKQHKKKGRVGTLQWVNGGLRPWGGRGRGLQSMAASSALDCGPEGHEG